jgi:drug/metabolite transporter (DMT)-like permease
MPRGPEWEPVCCPANDTETRRPSGMTAVIGGLVAAACFSASLLASSRASRMIGALPTLGGVMLVSTVVALPVAALTIGETRPTPDALPYLLIAGAGNVFGLLFEYIGLRSGKVGLVGALAAAEGAVAAVLSVVAGEALGPLQGLGVAVVAVGVIFAALGPDPDSLDAGSARRALVFGGLAGLAFGASLYSTGRIGSDLAVGWAILPPRIVGMALIVMPLLATRRLLITRPSLPFVVVAGLGEVGGFLAFAWAARDSIAVGSALAAQFATVAAIVAWLVLGERLGRLQWAGVAGVAVGVVLLALGAT